MYITTAILSGQLSPLAYPNYIPETEHYLKLIVGITVLFYSSLAAIKISFLLFFHRLLSGVRIKAMMVQWWVIFGITLATWIASIGNIPYKCLVRPFTHIVQDCTGHWAISFQRITLSVNCAMDVVTDALSKWKGRSSLGGIPTPNVSRSYNNPSGITVERPDRHES